MTTTTTTTTDDRHRLGEEVLATAKQWGRLMLPAALGPDLAGEIEERYRAECSTRHRPAIIARLGRAHADIRIDLSYAVAVRPSACAITSTSISSRYTSGIAATLLIPASGTACTWSAASPASMFAIPWSAVITNVVDSNNPRSSNNDRILPIRLSDSMIASRSSSLLARLRGFVALGRQPQTRQDEIDGLHRWPGRLHLGAWVGG